MKKRKKQEPKAQPKPTVSVDPTIQTVEGGQKAFIKISVGEAELVAEEEQAIDVCFRLAGMLPNSMKTRLSILLLSDIEKTFK